MLWISISINPWSSETLARVQCVKNGNPKLSTARCRLIPFVALYEQKPLEAALALQVFFTACESMMISVVHRLFFELAAAPLHAGPPSIGQKRLHSAIACNASRLLSRAESLWVSHSSYTRF